jgi:thiol-disulfide isomerase/thioredoxin
MHPHSITRRGAVATLLAGAATVATARAAAAPLHDHGAAPEFTGIEQWLQSPPLTMAGLRGRVVLIDFWTFACINCIRTLPHVNRWHAAYAAQGLTVVGVHTPEFAFERPTPSVQAAMEKLGVKHAVAQDNRYATWKAWQNRYWPAHYLVDAQGRVQYRHYGEGDYDRTEAAIRALLAQRRTTA